MYLPRKTAVGSAFGAVFAAALLTIVTVLPDAVHAKTPYAKCARTFTPSIQ